MKDTPIVKVDDVDVMSMLSSLGVAKNPRGRKLKRDRRTGEKYRYVDVITAFDVETSKHRFHVEGWQSWVYVWQWQIGDVCTIMGRELQEFISLVNQMNEYLQKQHLRLLVYVHELAFEFQFLSGVYQFEPQDVFATDQYAPLYCLIGNVELRCSRRFAACSLKTWGTKRFHVDHPKLDGYDYSVVRYPWTPLTDDEIRYCVNDVMCVVECIHEQMKLTGNTIYDLPLTSISYVRKPCRNAMRMWSLNACREIQNPLYVYDRLRAANRGADAYANQSLVGDLLGEVDSFDISSSYPYVICFRKYPMTRFREEEASLEQLKVCIEKGRACLMKLRFLNIKLRDKSCLPYIPYRKCCEDGYKRPVKPELLDGRITAAGYCELAMTDLDYELICRYYEFEAVEVEWLMSSRYGYLPDPLIDQVIALFKKKTKLKNDMERSSEYQFSKIMVNSIYGMMAQQPIQTPIVWEDDQWKFGEYDREADYARAMETAWLSYAWAVWVTAWARYRLHEGFALVINDRPDAFVYSDTDSIKVRTELLTPDFSRLNDSAIKDCLKYGAFETGADGIVHYMGTWEKEDHYDYFRTLGMKRYVTVVGDKLRVAVSGVPSEEGAKVLLKDGGILVFDFSYVFHGTGKTNVIYNDFADFTFHIGSHILHITRNAVILDVDHQMKEDPDAAGIVSMAESMLDIIHNVDYNFGG